MYVFTWDARKSDANLRARGFDFAFAARAFDRWTIERPDTRRDYGEVRMSALGMVEGIHLTIIYTDRLLGDHPERRIISARPSSRRERSDYDKSLQDQKDAWSRPG
jgi:uncharacterized DUF497 family protein